MSNLWFFRLRRVEQQRRRSSGEQSAGSASVHSVASAGTVPSLGGQGDRESRESRHEQNQTSERDWDLLGEPIGPMIQRARSHSDEMRRLMPVLDESNLLGDSHQSTGRLHSLSELHEPKTCTDFGTNQRQWQSRNVTNIKVGQSHRSRNLRRSNQSVSAAISSNIIDDFGFEANFAGCSRSNTSPSSSSQKRINQQVSGDECISTKSSSSSKSSNNPTTFVQACSSFVSAPGQLSASAPPTRTRQHIKSNFLFHHQPACPPDDQEATISTGSPKLKLRNTDRNNNKSSTSSRSSPTSESDSELDKRESGFVLSSAGACHQQRQQRMNSNRKQLVKQFPVKLRRARKHDEVRHDGRSQMAPDSNNITGISNANNSTSSSSGSTSSNNNSNSSCNISGSYSGSTTSEGTNNNITEVVLRHRQRNRNHHQDRTKRNDQSEQRQRYNQAAITISGRQERESGASQSSVRVQPAQKQHPQKPNPNQNNRDALRSLYAAHTNNSQHGGNYSTQASGVVSRQSAPLVAPGDSAGGGSLARHAGQYFEQSRPPPSFIVPQVTIIRSDSTSSFIPLSGSVTDDLSTFNLSNEPVASMPNTTIAWSPSTTIGRDTPRSGSFTGQQHPAATSGPRTSSNQASTHRKKSRQTIPTNSRYNNSSSYANSTTANIQCFNGGRPISRLVGSGSGSTKDNNDISIKTSPQQTTCSNAFHIDVCSSEPEEELSSGEHSDAKVRAQLISGKVPPILHKSRNLKQHHDQRLMHQQPTIMLSTDSGTCLANQNTLLCQSADSLDKLASLIPRVRVKFYNSGNTLKERLQLYLIKDHTINLYVRAFKLILKVIACYLYVCRVMLDRGPAFAACNGCTANNSPLTLIQNLTTIPTGTSADQQASSGPGQVAQENQSQLAPDWRSTAYSKFDAPYDGPINFQALFWVDRGPVIWMLQTCIAVICFFEAILMQYLTYKNSIFSIISFNFILNIVTNVPFIISIFWRQIRTIFVPGFLNCWLAKACLEALLNDLSIARQSSVFSHRLTILSATVFCLIFTSACGFQHTQRSGGRNYVTIFESFYFVVVTFSTVGYGDFKPETWPSQLFIMVMICVALIVLPTQFEQLAYFWIERKKLGASYAHHSTRHEKHVVVCSTTLRADTIMDFLNEFYAHPLLQPFSVVLLSPCELDSTMKIVLQTPTWNNRVVYIQGSALKASDLIRARMQSAEACFILAARNYNDRSAADEHTILRSWAIRDFSPYVPQYVQIFRTENKIHVAFADHVVCDDEFKYALLANNCLIPGTSTLVTLLLHTTSQQQQHQQSRNQKKRRRHRKQRGGTSGGGGFFSNLLTFSPFPRGSVNVHIGGHCEMGACSNNNPEAGVDKMNQALPDYKTIGSGDQNKTDNQFNEGDEEDSSDEDPSEPEWRRLYGRCSANEIYHIRLDDSRFFGEYQGKSFTYASFHSHRKFGVALIGVQTDMRGTWPIMLNPGPSYVLKSSDILFYINVTKEENSALMPMQQIHSHQMQQSASYQQLLRLRTASMSQKSPDRVEQIPSEPPDSGGARSQPASRLLNQSFENNHDKLITSLPDNQSYRPTVQHQTEIRIESTSPVRKDSLSNSHTATLHHDTPPTDQQLQQYHQQQQQYQAHPVAKKHSVADGAGIVAKSFCSVAGLSLQADECERALASPATSTSRAQANMLSIQSGQTSKRGRRERRSKRNSSASTAGVATDSTGGGGVLGVPGGGSNLNVSSTFELASLANRLRKGSNLSINSSKSRDASPTRLKQVVNGLVVKMKRVKLGKSLTHLTIPRMDLGGGSSASSTESFVNARGRRPSIAPVPAMMGESEEHDSDHEREQESYFSMLWQSSSEQSPIVKRFVFCTTYIGVSPTLCYMLQRKKLQCCLQLTMACEHCPFKNARQYNWPARCIILASDFASNGIYNFLVPLRAHFHKPNELRPIVLLLERKPSPQFIDAISWFPMVYWMPGSIDNLDDLIKAGINLAHSVVVTNKESTNSAEEDYLADCNTIVAVQTMFKMFPTVGIITELSQSSNMRFMQFRAHDLLFGPFSLANLDRALSGAACKNNKRSCSRQQMEQAKAKNKQDQNNESSGQRVDNDRDADGPKDGPEMSQQQQQQQNNNNNDELSDATRAIRDKIQLRRMHSELYDKQLGKEHAYKYRLPFAAGNVFSASMLDTLLYQAFVKDYMITMVRLLLGIDQAPGSGFLSSMRITKEDLWIRTYGRLYQRLCSTTCEIPLGIYRTEPLESKRSPNSSPGGCETGSFGPFMSQQANYEHATEELERSEISNMVRNRLEDLGMLLTDYDDSPVNRNNTFSYVIINPNCDISLHEGDIIYLIRPSPIHSRKLFINRAKSFRHNDIVGSCAGNASHHSPKAASANNQFEPHPSQTSMNMSPHNGQAGGPGPSAAPSYGGARQSVAGNTHIKSCLSDGDFNEILIKVNDHEQMGSYANNTRDRILSPVVAGSESHESLRASACAIGPMDSPQRRRSSCSDADEQQSMANRWRDSLA